jgi:hypothetical protein
MVKRDKYAWVSRWFTNSNSSHIHAYEFRMYSIYINGFRENLAME